MKVFPELMRACGSGANPKDLQCVEGYDYFVAKVTEYDPVDLSFPTLAVALAEMKRHTDEGDVEREKGIFYQSFLRNLKSKPIAIRMGGCLDELPVWRFKEQEFSTLEQARAAKAQIETDTRSKPFEHVNVLRHIKTSQGATAASVKAWGQIRPDAKITVFDPKTGKHNEPADVEAEVERVLQQHLDRAMAEPIFRKIRDTQEGFEAWEPVK